MQVAANFALLLGGFRAPAQSSCNGIRGVRPVAAPVLVLLRVCSGAARHGRTERPQRVPFPAGSGWRGPNSPLISPYHAPTALRAVGHYVPLFSSALPPWMCRQAMCSLHKRRQGFYMGRRTGFYTLRVWSLPFARFVSAGRSGDWLLSSPNTLVCISRSACSAERSMQTPAAGTPAGQRPDVQRV